MRSKMGVTNTDIITQFIRTLRTGHGVSKEHRDYILIKELYHCTPSELDKQSEHTLQLHYTMLMEERKREAIEHKRAEQRAKNSHK